MKIAILGEGITGKAVRQKLEALPEHQLVSIDDAEVIVTSPGIPPEQFPRTDTPVISEIELAWRLLQQCKRPPKIIGITGTNGKTTVTTLIGELLDCPVAGNIGQPLIAFVPENAEQEAALPEYISLELSSYQLETTSTLKPVVSIITNVTEDHLTRHKTMENYARIKGKLIENQTEHDLFIYNATDPYIKKLLPSCKALKKPFRVDDDGLDIRSHLHIPGDHNVENAMAAVYCALFLGQPANRIFAKLEAFQGVEHRIEYAGTINGLKCYNDSKGTNPESTIIALRALGSKGILILGGRDKLTSLDQMCEDIKKTISKTILIGEAADRFQEALLAHGYTSVYREADMVSAVQKGLSLATDEIYLLLSPACASFDMYNNFEERGRHFKSIIKKLASQR